jgi:hypothetical protein
LRQFETFVGNPASTLSNAKSPTPATGNSERDRTLFTSGRCVATGIQNGVPKRLEPRPLPLPSSNMEFP